VVEGIVASGRYRHASQNHVGRLVRIELTLHDPYQPLIELGGPQRASLDMLHQAAGENLAQAPVGTRATALVQS
jgi:hypothetical protein